MYNKLTLKEIIETSKLAMYKDNYVIACSDNVMDNKYNWLVVPNIDLMEKWYSIFCDIFNTVVIYQNGKYLQQPDSMN